MLARVFLLLCAAGLLAAAPKIVGGPIAVNVTARTATIVWVLQTDELILHPPGGPAKQSPSLHVERTNLTGLQPNTRYEYEAGGPGGVKGSFKTAPATRGGAPNTGADTAATNAAPAANGAAATAPSVPFTFFVFGDTRTRHDMHRRVMEAVVKHGIPDFVIHTGDLVADGNDSSLWPVFFDIERELLRQTAFFPSLGNHERNSRDYYEFFRVDTPYYGFNWGNAHFSVINSDYGNAASSEAARNAFWAEQTKWLEEDLAASQKADFRFVVGHHPPMSAVSRRQEFNPHMVGLVPILDKYNVTGGFFGHDHNYQHYLKNGIHYMITGGGGAPLYDVDKPDPNTVVKVVSTENFVTVSVDGKVAKVQARALDGKILDEFELKAR
jgi:3',5'-cyclic AMP phosphodiesterase CpdA